MTKDMLNFDAVIFDMDGVVTKTASVHSLAWKRMFDEYLREREKNTMNHSVNSPVPIICLLWMAVRDMKESRRS